MARSESPFRLDALWELVGALEHYGVAGFGWGVAWLRADGTLASHRDVGAFRDDDARAGIGANETTTALVHLRRPSRLSTTTLPDTQPFMDPAGRFVVAHNGDLEHERELRPRFDAQGRLLGRADTEVAARWLEDEWSADEPAAGQLARLHAVFGGNANLALITADGSATHYAGHRENPVFAYRLGSIRFISTGVHSLDRSLFRLVAPDARERRIIAQGTAVTI